MRITRSIKEENYDMIYERGLRVSLYYKLLYLITMFKNKKTKKISNNNNNPEKQLLLGLFEGKKRNHPKYTKDNIIVLLIKYLNGLYS